MLRERTDKTLYVMYSGGIDSEVVLDSFIAAKIDNWEVFMLNYEGCNEYDLEQAKKYLTYRGIENITEYQFDLRSYWISEVVDDMIHYGSISPQFPVYVRGMLHVCKHLGGFPVLGSAECYFEKHDDRIVMFEREKVASLYRGLYLNHCEGCAGFFQYTPELMASWMLDKEFEKQVLLNPDFTESLSLKHEIYMKHFDIPRRLKQTGFEHHRETDRELRQIMKDFPESAQDQIQYTEINDLKRQLGIL
jgi:hypothetical protein